MSVVSASSTTTDQKCFKKYQFYGDEIEFYFLLLLPKQYNVTNDFIAFACIKYHKQSREDWKWIKKNVYRLHAILYVSLYKELDILRRGSEPILHRDGGMTVLFCLFLYKSQLLYVESCLSPSPFLFSLVKWYWIHLRPAQTGFSFNTPFVQTAMLTA